MKAEIYISGIIEKGKTLKDVIRQFKSFEEPDSIEVDISTIGGHVNESDKVYNYLTVLGKELLVTTITDKAYSSGAKIFSAGTVRLIENKEKAMMIHMPWAKPEAGNAQYFEDLAEGMRGIEEDFTEFYSELVDIDKETIRGLLDNETFLSGEEAVEMGFATGFKEDLEAVAIYDKENSNTKLKQIMKKGKKKALFEAFLALFESEEAEVNALVLQDSNAKEIDFPDLEEGDIPKVGDKAEIDGVAIKDGSHIMPQLEEATVVFVDGVISEVLPKEEVVVEETEDEVQARLLEEAKSKIKAEEVQQISVWTMEVLNTSFAEGDTVKYKDWDDNEQTIGSGEFQLSDGRRVVTDATGVIVKVKEATAEKEVEVDVEARFKAIETKIEAKFETKLEAQKTEIEGLKIKLGKTKGSKELEVNAQEVIKKEAKKENLSLADICRGK